ncbi:MAG: tetratricopeptide repeat protein, partial [Planctomycetes bacterium]|nr:tetratricopeptide repeat protein [Planctomycetota bacterium]
LREGHLVRDYEAQTRAGTITWELQRDVGDFFLLRGDFTRAAEFYGHALDGRADDAELLARMGRARFLGGDTDDAARWFERARAADPDARVFEHLERGIAP